MSYLKALRVRCLTDFLPILHPYGMKKKAAALLAIIKILFNLELDFFCML
ncbi:MAG: hypothetical protein WCR42_07145 [bacterium]